MLSPVSHLLRSPALGARVRGCHGQEGNREGHSHSHLCLTAALTLTALPKREMSGWQPLLGPSRTMPRRESPSVLVGVLMRYCFSFCFSQCISNSFHPTEPSYSGLEKQRVLQRRMEVVCDFRAECLPICKYLATRLCFGLFEGFKIGSRCVTQAVLEFTAILLPPLPKCWCHRRAPPCPAATCKSGSTHSRPFF